MESDWTSLDDLIMEKIFTMLSIGDRFNASMVCQRWSLCFDLPKVWRKVDIDGYWLTKPIGCDVGKIHSSRILDYGQITNCLHRIGHHFRWINIRQTEHFASLYQLFVVFESYFNKMLENKLHQSSNISKFTFKFPCDQPLDSDPNGIKLFGIGGQLIGSFKKLLSKMPNLCELELVDLVLERYEANSLMDQISIGLSQSLKVLSIINLTVNHCPLQQISMLSNLEILKISPQNIDDSMLRLIAVSKLKHLHIVQNENTPKTVMPCTAKAWTHFKRVASENIHVHLETNSNRNGECDLVIQPEAPFIVFQ
ncbi:uncharacterized protein LOC116340235 [Contarinia nasturtii]|uniref:uncharacterized protein LOC116340235 n=1 Tax=Contarinia nasturtii TaxID=265458 RepID=UPI0012D472C7|nr:uncharacterized protein LOC116340235 [Contarinia nasturtii]